MGQHIIYSIDKDKDGPDGHVGQYIICSIEDNEGGSDGHIIIVKANPIKKALGFDHLTKLSGKNYYNYSLNETDETEWFVFPYSEERKQELISYAKNAENNHIFWKPTYHNFYDACILLEGNKTKLTHKYISLRKDSSESFSGIKDIINAFNINNSLIESYTTGKSSDVQKVHLHEGCLYSGKAIISSKLCLPNGYGVKLYKSGDKKKIASFFKKGKIGKIALIMYFNRYMYIGDVFEEIPNGWGFKLAKGQFTFGYFKDGKLYKDLSPFATDLYYSITRKGIDVEHLEGAVNRLAFGLLPNENRPFEGFYFFEDGSVYLGLGFNKNEYSLTGRFIHFEIDGKVTFGLFVNGDVAKRMTQEEYFKEYTSKGIGNEKIDTTTNYLTKADCRLYLIESLQTSYDFDMGQIMTIYAIPFDTLKMEGNTNIQFNTSQIEYFCFQQDDNAIKAIEGPAQEQRLWKVNLDDFNNHYGLIPDADTGKIYERNFHLHNQLIGLEYSSFLTFDTVDVYTRLVEKDFFEKNDIDVVNDKNNIERPF